MQNKMINLLLKISKFCRIRINYIPLLDRWILSELNTLIKNVEVYYEDYEPTRVARLIQDFVMNGDDLFLYKSLIYLQIKNKRSHLLFLLFDALQELQFLWIIF